MKKTSYSLSRFAGIALLLTGWLTLPALAQQTPAPAKDRREVTIKITERTDDGKVRELERSYQLDKSADNNTDALVNRLVDSLKLGRPAGQRTQMTITVEDNDNQTRMDRRDRKPGKDAQARRDYDRQFQFRFDMDSVRGQADRMRGQADRFRLEIPRDWDRQLMQPFENWARDANMKPASVRGLQVYPNNPDRNVLNIRFSAPAKGDVLIVITNAKGKEVSRKEINEFSGDYVSQIDLNKRASGTLFVTVTQNEDGAVKRVVVD
jgi:hypothetical protein